MQMKFRKLSRILIVGLPVVAALGFCSSIPFKYEASSGIRIDFMNHLEDGRSDINNCDRFDLAGYARAHIPRWRSTSVNDKVMERMAVRFQGRGISVNDLASELTNVRFDVLQGIKLRIGICSSRPEVCAGVVNAYADVVCECVNNESRTRDEKALKAICDYIDTTRTSIEAMKKSLAHAVASKSDEVNELQSKLLKEQALFKGLQQDALACTSGVRSVAASSVWRAEVPKWPVVLWRMRHGFGLSQLLDEDP